MCASLNQGLQEAWLAGCAGKETAFIKQQMGDGMCLHCRNTHMCADTDARRPTLAYIKCNPDCQMINVSCGESEVSLHRVFDAFFFYSLNSQRRNKEDALT